jgi:dTDP-4-amino-4,6-dideoxygalactose transaminase
MEKLKIRGCFMQVPFLNLTIQYQLLKNEINSGLQKIFDTTSFISGKAVKSFETDFAGMHNVKYCHGVSSGTDANHLVLWASGIKAGDEVIIPANTFIATAWGATLNHATPVFVDCHPDSYNIDPDKIESAITSRTKAIVAVHLYGQPANMDEIRKIAEKYNLLLFEDAAQAHMAEYKNLKVGGLSNAASFSFYPGKNLGAYGEAGAVTTNDPVLADLFNKMRNHGQSEKYFHDVFGHNYRMEEIQGTVLGIKLKYLDQWTNARRRAALKYKFLLQDIEHVILPYEMSYAKHVYHLFVIQVKGGNEQRDRLAQYLNENGISTGLHYPVPLHLQKCFDYLGYKKGDFPVTEKLAETGLSLPMFPELTTDQIEYVAENISEFFHKEYHTTAKKEYIKS